MGLLGKKYPQQNTDQTTLFVLKSNRNQILLSSRSSTGQMAESKPGVPPPPQWFATGFRKCFVGALPTATFTEGKITANEECSL